ncbi:MAG: porin family protein [Treponema sp.]|nr:porin family protein [Treponema sp.]
MKNTMFVKAAAFLLLFVGLTVGASAQITVSGGLALSQLDADGEQTLSGLDGGIGFGGNVYVDYILPINIPLSLGAEVGVDSAKFDSDFDDTMLAIPVLARVAYHFDILPKLDLYVVGKIGIAFGSWKGETKDAAEDAGASVKTPPGFAFGFDVGAAYYFTSTIGVFAEAGFDRYDLSAKLSAGGSSFTLKAPFNRFFTVGISAKF